MFGDPPPAPPNTRRQTDRNRLATRPEVIPSPYDAQVITLGAIGATITGIERVPARDGFVEVQQPWWIRFV